MCKLGTPDQTLAGLGLFQYDFCGFDDRRDRGAYFEFHFIGAALGDHAFDQVFAHADDHVGHHSAELEFYNLSIESITR